MRNFSNSVTALEGAFFKYSKFGDGSFQQVVWNIQCSGSENNLSLCNNYYNENCYYGRTVGVRCYSKIINAINVFIRTFLQIMPSVHKVK